MNLAWQNLLPILTVGHWLWILPRHAASYRTWMGRSRPAGPFSEAFDQNRPAFIGWQGVLVAVFAQTLGDRADVPYTIHVAVSLSRVCMVRAIVVRVEHLVLIGVAGGIVALRSVIRVTHRYGPDEDRCSA